MMVIKGMEYPGQSDNSKDLSAPRLKRGLLGRSGPWAVSPCEGAKGAEMSRRGLRPQGVLHLVRERDT